LIPAILRFVGVLLVCATLLAGPRAAQADDHNAAIWLVNEFTLPLGERLSVHAMLQNRWTQDLDQYERTVVRSWVGIELPRRFRIDFGYDHHAFETPDRYENRAWQRIAFSHPLEDVRLLAHFWLEERFFEGVDRVGFRGRFNVGGSKDLGRDFSLLIRNEFLFDLNETSRIRRTGLGENHFVVSITKQLRPGLGVHFGYLQRKSPALADWF
jgi:hypothetical protein